MQVCTMENCLLKYMNSYNSQEEPGRPWEERGRDKTNCELWASSTTSLVAKETLTWAVTELNAKAILIPKHSC